MSPLGTSKKEKGQTAAFSQMVTSLREKIEVDICIDLWEGGCNFGLHFQQVEMFPRERELLTGLPVPDTPSLEQDHLFLSRGRENFLKCGLPCFKLAIEAPWRLSGPGFLTNWGVGGSFAFGRMKASACCLLA